ncbi:MAG: prolyl oligopeptidase family serine peptidase, partial [Planctomycetes bacterium]|nr:prolyl oligopeptidase family serine peptidase [Planctomycetota bacterium]
MGPPALERGWLLVLPNFRGPNLPKNPKAPEACASIPAQHDVIDSVNYMIANFNVDKKRIYLTGGSGGGHMAHMMAAKYPDLWAGVSAWVSIT